MVRYGHFCKNAKFQITGYPQSSATPFDLKVYKLDGAQRAFTLHIVVKSTEVLHHGAMMAVNEKGVPSGHFHAHACTDPNEVEGKKNLNDFKVVCTRKGIGFGTKWGVSH